MDTIIGLKDLRENLPAYEAKVKRGATFLVVKKSKPIFRITPPDDNENIWEEVIDFTKIKKGGTDINDLLSRL